MTDKPKRTRKAKQEIIPAGAPIGRPLTYSDDIAQRICERLAMDESLVSICSDETMPSQTTVYRWRHEREDFRESYRRAREDQGTTVADQLGEYRKKIIAGTLDPAAGRAAADIAKWEASRRSAKEFGDKLDLTSSDGSMTPKGLEDFYGAREEK